MIVRINQFEVAQAEALGGWGDGAYSGPIQYDWPDETYAFEVLVLETDECDQRLTASFRQQRVRELLPQLLMALREPGMELVLRLDGALTTSSLLPLFQFLAPEQGGSHYGIAPALRLPEDPDPAQGSIRLHMDDAHVASLCAHPAISLGTSVRLRAFAVPAAMVGPLLDMSDLDDERWSEVLGAAGFMVQPVRALAGVQVLTQRFDPSAFCDRLTQRFNQAAAP